MEAEKVVEVAIRWEVAPHNDTARCVVPVLVPSRPAFNSRLALTAHVSRIPVKYGFSMLLAGERVSGLDVNPGRAHTNFKTGRRETVWETHWQDWPSNEAQPDLRTMSHRQWFREFCERNKILCRGSYRAPPHFGGEQLRLL